MKELLYKYIGFLIVFFSPLAPALMSILFIVIMDMITGIIAARKMKIPITSRKLSATITKLTLYMIAVMTAHVTQMELVSNIIPLVKVVLGLIALTELKSIFENINKSIGVNFWIYVKEYLTRSKGVINDKSDDKREVL